MTNIRTALMVLTLAALCCHALVPQGEASAKKKVKPARDDGQPALIQGIEPRALTGATPPGRFQLAVSGVKGSTALLCDTATGQVWWVRLDQGTGVPDGVPSGGRASNRSRSSDGGGKPRVPWEAPVIHQPAGSPRGGQNFTPPAAGGGPNRGGCTLFQPARRFGDDQAKSTVRGMRLPHPASAAQGAALDADVRALQPRPAADRERHRADHLARQAKQQRNILAAVAQAVPHL